MTAARRKVTFTSLDQVMPEVDRLLEGHETVGNWTLGQICNHLSNTLIFSVEGYPGKAPWLVRKLIAPMILRRLMKTGEIPNGAKVPNWMLPKPGLDDRAEAEALRSAIRMYTAHTGPLAPHPFFDAITRDQQYRLHCLHCAHHLTFAQPVVKAGAGRHESKAAAV